MKLISILMCCMVSAAAVAATPRTPAPQNVELYFIHPQDGAVVSSPVLVQFGLRGMGVAPAGAPVPDTGHHHLLVDTEYKTLNRAIPKDDRHLHFGGGQTETRLQLAPGKHRLQLLLGDHAHIPHQPPVMSKPITITVK